MVVDLDGFKTKNINSMIFLSTLVETRERKPIADKDICHYLIQYIYYSIERHKLNSNIRTKKQF